MADLDFNLRRLAELATVWRDGARAFRRVSRRVFQWAKPIGVGIAKKKATNDLLHVRSSRYRDAIDGEIVDDTPGRTSLVLGLLADEEPVVYGPIQEWGGTVEAKDKRLTIPTDFAKTPAGIPRFTARGAEAEYDTFLATSQAGNDLIFGRPKGQSRAKALPLFVLKDEVTIPATHLFGSTVEELRPLVVERLELEMAAMLAARSPVTD